MGDERVTCAIPVIDLKRADLEAVRAGTEELGAIQVVSHGVPEGLSGDLERRMARLLSLPRAGRPGWPARTRTGAAAVGPSSTGGKRLAITACAINITRLCTGGANYGDP